MCLIAFAGAGMVNCSDDDEPGDGAKSVEEMVDERYPGATDVTSGSENGLVKATFLYNGEENVGWLTGGGEWVMTQSKIAYEGLPSAVKSSFEGSEYANYPQNAVYKYDLEAGETTYVLSLIKDSRPTNLWYRENGELYRTAENIFKEQVPVVITEEQQKVLDEKYPNASILEARLTDRDIPEIEDEIVGDPVYSGQIRINIMDNGVYKEIIFNHNTWIRARWRFCAAPECLSDEVKEIIEEMFHNAVGFGNITISDTAIYDDLPNSNAWNYYNVVDKDTGMRAFVFIDPAGTVRPGSIVY